MSDRMLDTAQAAHRLGCSQQHIRNLIHRGKLPSVDIGSGEKLGRFRIPEAALIAFAKAQESVALQRMKTR